MNQTGFHQRGRNSEIVKRFNEATLRGANQSHYSSLAACSREAGGTQTFIAACRIFLPGRGPGPDGLATLRKFYFVWRSSLLVIVGKERC